METKKIKIVVLVRWIICLIFACVNIAAAGPGPHVTLLSTNQSDRLTQEQIAGGMTVYDAAHNCRKTVPATDKYIYFKLNDSYIYQGNYPIAHVSIAYYDIGTEAFALAYDATSNIWKTAGSITRTNTGLLKWATFDLPDAYFGNRENTCDLRIWGGNTDPLYVSKVYVWCRKENAGNVSISGGQFRINNERFVMVGASYVPRYQTVWANWEQVWKTLYNATIIENDFADMEKAGVNSIRTFLGFQDYVSPSEGVLNSTVITNLKDFYQRASNHGIKIQLETPMWPNWLKAKLQRDYAGTAVGADMWTNAEARKCTADFLVQLINTANLGSYDSFLSIELTGEAFFANAFGTAQEFYDSIGYFLNHSNATLRAWNRWVNAKYASPANAYSAWGYQGADDTTAMVYPDIRDHFLSSGSWDKKVDDYYAFIADSFAETVEYIRSRVKAEALSRAMITVNTVIRGLSDVLSQDVITATTLTTDAKRISQACDYVSFNIYNGSSTDPNWLRGRLAELVYLGLDQPVVFTEFAYSAFLYETTRLEEQRKFWKGMMEAAAEARVDGCWGWQWRDLPSQYGGAGGGCGILDPNGVKKPAYGEFTNIKVNLLTVPEPVANCTLEINMDGYVSPIQAFYSEGRNLVVSLFNAGKYPDMITRYREAPFIDTIYQLPVQGGDPIVGSLGVGAARGATILEDTIPDFMVSGLTYDANVTVMNLGTTTWTQAALYRLGTSDTLFGVGRWLLGGSESIARYGEKTFPMTLTAPATPGTYSRTWRMVQDGVAWFGQSHPHTIKVVAKPDKGARIISHDIPSVVSAGSVFTVHITVRNEGTTTWTQATNFKLGAVDNSDPFAATRQLLGPSDSIAAGQTKTFTFTMTAPNTPGYYYQTDWRMLQESVTWFGQKIDVEVGVN